MDASLLDLTLGPPAKRYGVDAMLTDGYVEMDVDSSILSEHLPAIREGMRRLTDDPVLGALFPKQVPFVDEVGWDMEAGLVPRIGKDATGNVEEKTFFHYISKMRWQKSAATWRFADFLSACECINLAAKHIALVTAAQFDEMHKLVRSSDSLVTAILQGTTVTRILRYKDTGKARADAYTHIDRSAISVHWWASHPGLVIIGNDGTHHRVDEAALNKVAVFPGKKFAGLFPDKCGYGTLHGVRDARDDRERDNEDRYSLVTFVHPKLTPEAAAWILANDDAMEALEKAHPL